MAALKQAAKNPDSAFFIGLANDLASTSAHFRQEFERLGAVQKPKVIGAIDVTYTFIGQPEIEVPEAYYAVTKRGYTVSSQVVVTKDLLFTRVDTGYPGRVNDARIFAESGILDCIPEGYQVLGDGAYPASAKLIFPFRDMGNLTQQQTRYNGAVSAVRQIVERGYGLAKRRWRVLARMT